MEKQGSMGLVKGSVNAALLASFLREKGVEIEIEAGAFARELIRGPIFTTK
jgi:hypothetical protein